MLVLEMGATFDPLEDMLAFELMAGFNSVDDTSETVMTGTMGLVTDDVLDTVDMLTLELAGQFDLDDVLETIGTSTVVVVAGGFSGTVETMTIELVYSDSDEWL